MKAQEMRDLPPDELRQQLEDIKKELFNLRVQQSTGQLEKPSRIRQLRRDIARAHTVLHERRLTEQRK